MERRRSALSGSGKLTAVALVVFAVCHVYEQVFIAQTLVPFQVVFSVVSLIIAGVVLRGWRRAPMLGAAWLGLVFVMGVPFIIADLGNPAALHPFVWQIATTATALIGIAAGIAATAQSQRGRAVG